jgi:hypothetical protein
MSGARTVNKDDINGDECGTNFVIGVNENPKSSAMIANPPMIVES